MPTKKSNNAASSGSVRLPTLVTTHSTPTPVPAPSRLSVTVMPHIKKPGSPERGSPTTTDYLNEINAQNDFKSVFEKLSGEGELIVSPTFFEKLSVILDTITLNPCDEKEKFIHALVGSLGRVCCKKVSRISKSFKRDFIMPGSANCAVVMRVTVVNLLQVMMLECPQQLHSVCDVIQNNDTYVSQFVSALMGRDCDIQYTTTIKMRNLLRLQGAESQSKIIQKEMMNALLVTFKINPKLFEKIIALSEQPIMILFVEKFSDALYEVFHAAVTTANHADITALKQVINNAVSVLIAVEDLKTLKLIKTASSEMNAVSEILFSPTQQEECIYSDEEACEEIEPPAVTAESISPEIIQPEVVLAEKSPEERSRTPYLISSMVSLLIYRAFDRIQELETIQQKVDAVCRIYTVVHSLQISRTIERLTTNADNLCYQSLVNSTRQLLLSSLIRGIAEFMAESKKQSGSIRSEMRKKLINAVGETFIQSGATSELREHATLIPLIESAKKVKKGDKGTQTEMALPTVSSNHASIFHAGRKLDTAPSSPTAYSESVLPSLSSFYTFKRDII